MLVGSSTPAPAPPPYPCEASLPFDHSKIAIGQSNASELRDYAQAFGSGWGNGVSMYWGLGNQPGAGFGADELAQAAVDNNATYALVGVRLAPYHDAAYAFALLTNISQGAYDEVFHGFVDTVVRKYPSLTWLVRIGYEVSLQYYANPFNEGVNATGACHFPTGTDDTGGCGMLSDDVYLSNKSTYQRAFAHVAGILHTASNARTVCHPFRLGAHDPVNNARLCPEDGSVDYFGVSVFNNDVCLPHGTQPAQGQFCEYSPTWGPQPYQGPYDPNLRKLMAHARDNLSVPLVIAESTTQPQTLNQPDWWEGGLARIAHIGAEFDLALWVYISTDWFWAANGAFRNVNWGDARLQRLPSVKSWWSSCILKHPMPPPTSPGSPPPSSPPPSSPSSPSPSSAIDAADVMPTPAGRGLYGWHLHSAAARRKLRHDRYVVLRRLLPPTLLTLLQRFYRALGKHPAVTAVFQSKTQRHEYLPEVLSTYLNLALVPFASAMSGVLVAPTYPFPITYVPGGSIHPHLDVSDNELSLTFQIELHRAKAWPLWFLDPRGQELSNLNASLAKQVTLADNDGILYYGPDIVHWRQPEPYTLTQVVFAFREEDEAHCNNQ